MVAHRRSIRGRTVRTNKTMDGSGGCDHAVWPASMTAAPPSWSLCRAAQAVTRRLLPPSDSGTMLDRVDETGDLLDVGSHVT